MVFVLRFCLTLADMIQPNVEVNLQETKAIKVKKLFTLIFVLGLIGMGTGCQVQKNEFAKKKWKIKKGQPPAQRYFNKWSLFNPDR